MGTTHDVAFSDQLPSRSNVHLKFLRVFSWFKSCFLFIAGRYSIVYMGQNYRCIYLGTPSFLPVLGSCDENCCKWLIPVQVLYGHRFPSPLNKYQGLQLLGSMVTSRFGFVRNHQTAFEAAARGLTPTSSA